MNIHPGSFQRNIPHDKSRQGSRCDADGNRDNAPIPMECQNPYRESADAEKDPVAEGNHPGEPEGQVEAHGEQTPYDDVFHQDIIGGQERKDQENKGEDRISDHIVISRLLLKERFFHSPGSSSEMNKLFDRLFFFDLGDGSMECDGSIQHDIDAV